MVRKGLVYVLYDVMTNVFPTYFSRHVPGRIPTFFGNV